MSIIYQLHSTALSVYVRNESVIPGASLIALCGSPGGVKDQEVVDTEECSVLCAGHLLRRCIVLQRSSRSNVDPCNPTSQFTMQQCMTTHSSSATIQVY